MSSSSEIKKQKIKPSKTKIFLTKFLNNNTFHICISALIILNFAILGLRTLNSLKTYNPFFDVVEHLILGIFLIEIFTRAYVLKMSFFKSPIYMADFIIVLITLLPLEDYIGILRIIRLFWVFGTISSWPTLNNLLKALYRALPYMATMCTILGASLYTTALLGTHFFAERCPEQFGDIFHSLALLSKALLMEERWIEIFNEVSSIYPYAWLFLAPAMILLNYLLLHMVIGIIITALDRQLEHEQEKAKKEETLGKKETNLSPHYQAFSTETQFLLQRIDMLDKNVQALQASIKKAPLKASSTYE